MAGGLAKTNVLEKFSKKASGCGCSSKTSLLKKIGEMAGGCGGLAKIRRKGKINFWGIWGGLGV